MSHHLRAKNALRALYRGKAIDLYDHDLIQQEPTERARDAKLRAAKAGHRVYRSNKQCRTCGTDIRYVHGGGCLLCMRAKSRARYEQIHLELNLELAKADVANAPKTAKNLPLAD